MKHEIELNIEIENILYSQTNVNSEDVNYVLHKNIVILKGVVVDRQKKRLLKQAILNLKGIKTVIDNIIVRHDLTSSLPALLR